MDIYFAVFNGYINDADRRARQVMSKECPSFLARVEKIERDGRGIMAIFEHKYRFPPDRAVKRYAELVQEFVNEAA